MYEWLEGLDLDYYGDIYSLFTCVKYKESIGDFTYSEENDIIIIGCTYIDSNLELKDDDERNYFLVLIEREYMDDMDAESWYGFNQAIEKDD